MFKRAPINNYHMHMVHRTNEGTELWLGDCYAAKNLQDLKQNNIRSVLTSAGELKISYPQQLEINHKIINALDIRVYKMTPHFQAAFAFIDEALKKGNILVHCVAGISRSTTLVLVYLMRTENMNFEQALSYVRKKRTFVCPNLGFEKELRSYETALKNRNVGSKDWKQEIIEEQKVVFDFFMDQKKEPKQEKFNQTVVGNPYHFIKNEISNKIGNYNAFTALKVNEFQNKKRAAKQSNNDQLALLRHHKIYSVYTKQFSSFYIQTKFTKSRLVLILYRFIINFV